MKRSERRILTTHVGSLPRTPALRDLLVRQDRGETVDAATLAGESEAAVLHVVRKQLEAGVDVGNDGEQPRVGFSTYPAKRMRGFGGASKRRMSRDIAEHPDYMARLSRMRTGAARINDAPQAVAEVAYTDLGEATAECEMFQRCVAGERQGFAEPFMTAASPGVIATIMLDAFYGSHERYIRPLASPRHQHELKAFRRHPLPAGMLFVPGVIDSTTNVVEHPEVVADRIVAAAEAIGDRTRVLASVDCGFGTFAGSQLVEESVVWTKLRALRDGADLATKRLWK